MAQVQVDQAAPFKKSLLSENLRLADVLPATARDQNDDLCIPFASMDELQVLDKELLVKLLNSIQSFLWLAGRPMPARHLGYQLVLAREIILTEEVSLHLTWKNKRLYLKPLPKFLLGPDVWNNYLVSQAQDTPEIAAQRQNLNACARGLLYSYCSLIAYESDFDLAQRLCLIPEDIKWTDWREWTKEILTSCTYATINPRYWYGELRLTRLNKICRWRKGRLLRGYSRVGSPSAYSDFLSENFGILAAILGYFVIVLTAMQVGLGTDRLKADSAFQDASYGFTVFSIIAPLGAVGVILLLFSFIFVGNWMGTRKYAKIRSDSIQVDLRTGLVRGNSQQVP